MTKKEKYEYIKEWRRKKMQDPDYAARQREYARSYMRKKLEDPAKHERWLAYMRERYARRKAETGKARVETEEQKKRRAEYYREYMRKKMADPEYAEKHRAAKRKREARTAEIRSGNATALKPWEALGISEPAYYRRLRNGLPLTPGRLPRGRTSKKNPEAPKAQADQEPKKYSPWQESIPATEAEYFRVSVLDERSMMWTVRAAGLTRKRAVEAYDAFFNKGLIARMTSCKPRK